jgi:hypothetical protein
MDQTAHRRVGVLVERVEGELGMVRQLSRLERNELAEDWIVARVSPVDPAQNVGSHPSGHGGGLDAVDNVRHELVAGLDLLVRAASGGDIGHGDLIGQHLLEKVSQLGLTLDGVLDLWVSVNAHELNSRQRGP